VADIDETGVGYCAEQFDGHGLMTSVDLTAFDLPKQIDLIWVGSVFTHLDWTKSTALFDKLASALGPRGVLIATFRGEHMYRVTLAEKDAGYRAKWSGSMRGYEAEGVGFGAYNEADPDWGASLTSIERIVSLGRRHRDLRLISYTETGWAAAHDVAA
jgi:hypothetical protein